MESEITDYKPAFQAEIPIIRLREQDWLDLIGEEAPNHLEIHARSFQETEDETLAVTKGYMVILNGGLLSAASKFESDVLESDHDDTTDPHSKRKPELNEALFSLLKTSVNRESIFRALDYINRAARVLPPKGFHPERYSPLLEMLAETELINSINANVESETITKLLSTEDEAEGEKVARDFINDQIKRHLDGQIILDETTEKNPKSYFKEVVYQSTALNFTKRPGFISSDVWQAFKKHMTETRINPKIVDIDKDTPWILITFGSIDYQQEKILNALRSLKESGKRLPDIVVFITQGRKTPFIKYLLDLFPKASHKYIDDSLRQLQKLISTDRLDLFQAVYKDSKRAEESDPRITRVLMENFAFRQIFKR